MLATHCSQNAYIHKYIYSTEYRRPALRVIGVRGMLINLSDVWGIFNIFVYEIAFLDYGAITIA